ncbi:MAG: phosphoenolpyruvate synthase [Magnetococcales bacterium]|nr:phosphoenolpyruvate synthase [Magnetococcales bacterium]
MLQFGTKAETLALLEPLVKHARILPQIRLTARQWRQSPGKILKRIFATTWSQGALIVRSSARSEDTDTTSMAGHFTSVGNVVSRDGLSRAIEQVLASFPDNTLDDQIFIQPFLSQVRLSGVAFTRDPNNGSHYHVINYDAHSGSTDSVTSGAGRHLQTLYFARHAPITPTQPWGDLLRLLQELESLFARDALDVEFAVAGDGTLYLFQVRPLHRAGGFLADAQAHQQVLQHIHRKITTHTQPHPYLYGRRSIFGIMPDWNPAEIIGIRPRLLALSLYKELVTDHIWAYQRDNYGYRNLRSFPLLIDFAGLPYIDVRVSFNSFVPADIPDDLAERLVNHYIDRLEENPHQHDKVEFDVIYSCYTFDLPERLLVLHDDGFSQQEIETLEQSLRRLTNRIIGEEAGLWKGDIKRVQELEERRRRIIDSDQDLLSKIYWILEDCKRYGTLPFAGLARAGFIAVQMLKSMVQVGVLSARDYGAFMSSLQTVSSHMGEDFHTLGREEFLSRYGHLRPGTYNILSPRYDENPELYFDWSARTTAAAQTKKEARESREPFSLTLGKMENILTLLKKHGIDHDVLSLFKFIQGAIEGREQAKFIFTKSLSAALQLFEVYAEKFGFTRDDLSYADIGVIHQLYSGSEDPSTVLAQAIAEGRRRYAMTQSVSLPPLIVHPEDVYQFQIPVDHPNYITLENVVGEVVHEDTAHEKLKGNVVMISNADPGYDWLFSHGIGGFITEFGGVNSHMAIRAGELGIPAVIGAGEILFREWSQAKVLAMDCANRQVRVMV